MAGWTSRFVLRLPRRPHKDGDPLVQPRLFRLAPEAMHCQASYVPGEGWQLTVGVRRQDEQWPDSARRTFSHLSTEELLDVLDACARCLLQDT